MTSALSPQDFDDLHDFIRTQISAGYAPADEIVADAVDMLTEHVTDRAAVRLAAAAIADQALAAHVDQQAGWHPTTDCDRLDAAFAELEVSGILARQHFSCCGTCGSSEIRDELDQAEKAGAPARGFTFFHIQDTEHAVAGDPLYLSYGAASREQDESVAIGHEVMGTLGRHGLAPAWNGKVAHRIALPLTWQRRR